MSIPTTGTPRLVTGCQNVYVAEVLTDVDGGSTTYDTPVRLNGVTDSIDITDNVNSTVYYGDNRAAASTQAKGVIDLTMSKQDIDDAQMAYILGNAIVNEYVEDKFDDNPPYFATQYELTYDDGGSKFVQIDKVRFQENTPGATTKTDTTEYQPMELIGQGIARLSDGRRKRSRTASAADVDTVRAAFFGNANDSTVTALTLTTTPLDAATGVVVTADIVLDYNNDMLEETFTASNIKLIKVSDGSEVALTWTTSDNQTWNGAHADLDAATAYLLIVTDNVRDVFGQGVEAIVNFTTA